jgi:hypothetical protein
LRNRVLTCGDAGVSDHDVVVRTVGSMVLWRLVGLLGLGPSPDAKD